MFADAKLVLSGEKLSAVGRAVLQLRRNLAWAAPDARPKAIIDCVIACWRDMARSTFAMTWMKRWSGFLGLMTGETADDLFVDAAPAFGLGMAFRGISTGARGISSEV